MTPYVMNGAVARAVVRNPVTTNPFPEKLLHGQDRHGRLEPGALGNDGRVWGF